MYEVHHKKNHHLKHMKFQKIKRKNEVHSKTNLHRLTLLLKTFRLDLMNLILLPKKMSNKLRRLERLDQEPEVLNESSKL